MASVYVQCCCRLWELCLSSQMFSVKLHQNLHPWVWHAVRLHFVSFKYRKIQSELPVLILKRFVGPVAFGLWSIIERETTNRVEGVYPSASLFLFLSHKQIFILPVCPDISLFLPDFHFLSCKLFSLSSLSLSDSYLCEYVFICVYLFVPSLHLCCIFILFILQ